MGLYSIKSSYRSEDYFIGANLLREKKIYIYIYGVGGVWVQLYGSQGARDHVIFVLRECILKAPAVSLVLPGFDDTGPLGFLRVG